MNIYQIVPNLSYGDGVGNDILAIDRLLKKIGYTTCVYAIVIDTRIDAEIAKPFSELPDLNREDIIIFHLAVGSELNEWFEKCKCRKIVRYHNITPATYFENYSKESVVACEEGLKEIKHLKYSPEYCIADSEFNKKDLLDYGYKMPIDVAPILIPFEDYNKAPDDSILDMYRDGLTNILFTGRIVPNKKQEDVIKTFYYYQKYYNPDSRLFLVGSYNGMEKYYRRLKRYAEELGVRNVVFTGHIKFESILSYYRLADIFLCMSEHEGFCIPLVEAMYFGIPIVACDNAAVGETLGNAGILMPTNDCLVAAGCIEKIMCNSMLKKAILENQKKELQRFSTEVVENRIMILLKSFILDKI